MQNFYNLILGLHDFWIMLYFLDFRKIYFIKFPRNFTKISFQLQNLLKILVKIPDNFSNIRRLSIFKIFQILS